jgi:hypothetical protein
VTETGEARTDGLGLSGNGVTEESLAGMTPAERQAAINLADARRNARAERARRQGSQRSVKSLPRYTYDVDPQEMSVFSLLTILLYLSEHSLSPFLYHM